MASRGVASDLGIDDDDEFAHLLDDDASLEAAAPSAKRAPRYTPAASATSRLADDGDVERRLAAGIAADSGETALHMPGSDVPAEPAGPELSEAERQDIADRLDAADREPGPAALNAQQARRLAAAVAKANERNQMERSKHPDEPGKFMGSELELHDAVRALQEVASAPELLGEVVECGGAEAVLAVVGHPNGDVSVAALEFLDEALEAEAEEGGAAALGEAVVLLGGCEAVVQRLWGLDRTGDDDDAQGAQRALGVCEQLLTTSAGAAAPRLVSAGLGEFLLRRLQQAHGRPGPASSAVSSSAAAQASGEDGVMHQSADVLCLLLQAYPPFLASLPSLRLLPLSPRDAAAADGADAPARTPDPAPADAVDGVELLARAAAAFRREDSDPASAADRECCEAVFQALSRAAAAAGPAAAERRAALEACEGVELLVLVAQRPRLYARHCALVCLGGAITGWPAGALSALRAGALGAASAAFMGRASAATRRLAGRDAAEEEASAALRVFHLVVAAVGAAPAAPSGGAGPAAAPTATDRLRVVAKMLEDDGAKAARLVDVLSDTSESVGAAGRAAEAAGGAAAADAARMEAGLERLTLAAALAARLCELDPRVRARLLSRMAALRLPAAVVADALEEAVAVAGEEPADMSRLAVMMRGFDAGAPRP